MGKLPTPGRPPPRPPRPRDHAPNTTTPIIDHTPRVTTPPHRPAPPLPVALPPSSPCRSAQARRPAHFLSRRPFPAQHRSVPPPRLLPAGPGPGPGPGPGTSTGSGPAAGECGAGGSRGSPALYPFPRRSPGPSSVGVAVGPVSVRIPITERRSRPHLCPHWGDPRPCEDHPRPHPSPHRSNPCPHPGKDSPIPIPVCSGAFPVSVTVSIPIAAIPVLIHKGQCCPYRVHPCPHPYYGRTILVLQEQSLSPSLFPQS